MIHHLEHEGLKLKITELEPDINFEMKESDEYALVRFTNLTLKIECEEYKKIKNTKCFDVNLSCGMINIDLYQDDRFHEGFAYGLMLGARNSIHFKDIYIEVNVPGY